MAHLQRLSHRLIWLNPLLGSPSYQPLTKGMMAALPYVDDFLPVHNLASLERLAEELRRVRDRRPERGQQVLQPEVRPSLPRASGPRREQSRQPAGAPVRPASQSRPAAGQPTRAQQPARAAESMDPMYGHVERHIIPLTGR
jgi:hypothetical protein